MGILDEAIRQHLDLKRRHGAQDSEVKRLEDEAFGLPTRPGEPDFPESEEQVAASADEAGAAAQPAPADAGAPVAEPDSTAAIEHPVVEEPATEPPSEEATLFYDQTDAGDAEHDDARDALMEEAQIEDGSPPPEDALPPSEEHPIISQETVEHPMEELLEEEPAPDGPATDEEPLEEGPGTGEESAAELAEDEEDADVLEETPEFLRDRPEDDELWFEQGKPKDFDF